MEFFSLTLLIDELERDAALLQAIMDEDTQLSKYRDSELWSNPLVKKYIDGPAFKCQLIVEGDKFNLFIIFVIVAAGVVVGLQTYDRYIFITTSHIYLYIFITTSRIYLYILYLYI